MELIDFSDFDSPDEEFWEQRRAVGREIRRRRELAGLSLRETAQRFCAASGETPTEEHVDMVIGILWAYENGTRLPITRNLHRLSRILGCSKGDLDPAYIPPPRSG